MGLRRSLILDSMNAAKRLTAESGGDWQGYLDGAANEFAPITRFATPAERTDFFVFLCSERAK